jgi:alkanesulfonate monooxygenase SsuD/methylene tetrahydromethanopterin reductase-like flavin-dependent oxidoreductase (luciferase family)
MRAMRALWRDDVASFEGEFVSFSAIRVNPKPVRSRGIPVVLGGNSDAALRRVADWGDGWYGFNLDGLDAVRERLSTLDRLCAEAGRDRRELDVAIALTPPSLDDPAELAELGVQELVLVEGPPEDPHAAAEWIGALAERWEPYAAFER